MMAMKTLVHGIEHWANARPNHPALHGMRDGRWYHVNWSEYWRSVRALGKAFIDMGHQAGECVAFIGANYPEWVQLQFGVQAARGIPAPIYTTSTKEQAAYIVKHSRSKILVCDGAEQLERLLVAEREGLFPRFEHIVTFEKIDIEDARVVSFAELVARGEALSDAELDARLDALNDDETCLLIYTSGTTGVPKGVEVDHGGQLLVGDAVMSFYPAFLEEGRYHTLSYLPLTAQAEQCFTNVFTIVTGGEASFCPDLTQLKDFLIEVRPTVFLGMPRVWEKFESALGARLAETSGVKAKLAQWATKTELAAFQEQVERGEPGYMPLQRRLARKLVVDKIKGALGLDRLEIALSGSAPVSPSTQEFFASIGICVFEGYGLSETSGVATVTDYRKPRFGTVGRPLKGVEIRLAEEDEIQLRGRNMTKGYLHMPEETAALYTEDGWLRTGDVGAFDDEGNLKITGRIKDLLITAGGKNVAPGELENLLRSITGVGQAVVVGDRKPYLCALITLDPESVAQLCQAVGLPTAPISALATDTKVQAYLESEIQRTCNAKIARYQTIKKFHILPNEFTTESGELTATMKLRRNEITKKYNEVIEIFYVDSTKHAQRAHVGRSSAQSVPG